MNSPFRVIYVVISLLYLHWRQMTYHAIISYLSREKIGETAVHRIWQEQRTVTVKAFSRTAKFNFLISFFFLLHIFLLHGGHKPYFCCFRYWSSGLRRGHQTCWFWPHHQDGPIVNTHLMQSRGGKDEWKKRSNFNIRAESNALNSCSKLFENFHFRKY